MRLSRLTYDGPMVSYEVDASRITTLRKALAELVECGIPFGGFAGALDGQYELTTEPFESGEDGRMVVGLTLMLPRVEPEKKVAEASRLILQ